MNICLNCGKPMEIRTVVQLYCSKKCREEYYRSKDRKVTEANWPSITFACAKCGTVVTTRPDIRDRRTRFCSAACEKKYYRHPPWEIKKTELLFAGPPKPRIFDCAECGKHVVIPMVGKDRRWRFCSYECCQKYWNSPELRRNFPSTLRRRAHLFVPRVCACCGQEYIPGNDQATIHRRKYCSKECAKMARRERRKVVRDGCESAARGV